MARCLQILRDWTIASLACLVAVGAFQTAVGEPGRLDPVSPSNLHAVLGRYLAIESNGGWPTIPTGPALRIGSAGPSVLRLKERLSVTQDLIGGSNASSDFDENLSAAVMRFQFRHGLAIDGIVGPVTRAALNVSAGERVRQIVANLARLQSLPDRDRARAVVINVAGFDLNVIVDGKRAFSSPVIVGRLSRRTPVLSSVITKVIVNPYWRIPRRIAVEDILPKVKRDPAYLKLQSIRVFEVVDGTLREVTPDSIAWHSLNGGNFPYLLVQDPGPLNPLGRVKFFLPNEHDIFVHDTPARELFSHNLRAFSSGCIRVAKAVALAKYLLAQDGERSVHAMVEALQSGETKQISIADPIPVHIVYVTAWADESGYAHFRDDVYALDRLVDVGPAQKRGIRRDVARVYDRAQALECLAVPGAPHVLR